MLRNTEQRYGSLSIGLHWLTLLLMIAVYALMEFRDIFPKGSAGRDLMKEFHFMVGLLILALVQYLVEQRYRYVAFTATDQVRALFRSLGLQPHFLQAARRDSVPQPERWGRYYDHDPKVVAGDIRQGYQLLQQRPQWQQQLLQLPRCELTLNP